MTRTSQPVFLLGLGAQKAGTTWLHHYISQSAEVDPGLLKEYHIWNALTFPDSAKYDKRHGKVGRRRQARDLLNRLMRRPREPVLVRREMQRNPERYFDYFAGLLARDGIRMTGDMTPTHSALPTGTLVRIRDGFARRGITTRAVLLMRDPVDRCLWAIRMFRRNGGTTPGVDFTLPDDEVLHAYIGSQQGKLQGNYPHALDAMQAVFAPEDTYVGIYETMFRREELDRLSAFLGVDPDYSFVEQHFNVTEKATPLDEDVLQDAAMALAPVYEHCFARYPELRAHWRDPAGPTP